MQSHLIFFLLATAFFYDKHISTRVSGLTELHTTLKCDQHVLRPSVTV